MSRDYQKWRWPVAFVVVVSLSFGVSGCVGSDADGDGDGFSGDADCDDDHPLVHVGATEVAHDGVDQDCDGSDLTDEDGDGFSGGDEGDDCDDEDPTIYPGAGESPYDTIDQDCDGEDLTDVDGDGFAGGPGGDDCDDYRPDVNPLGVEICDDSADQDCDGRAPSCDEADLDGDGVTSLAGDCDDLESEVHPGAEEVVYNGRDDDCDPATRDDDLDQDGVRAETDCDDLDSSIYPGVDEVPYDGVDQDCSGADLTDVDGDGYDAVAALGPDCDDLRPDINPDATERPYDALDQDCDGSDTLGSPTLVAANIGSQSDPHVAFGADRYFVVWADDRSDQTAVFGQLLDSSGTALGAEIAIAARGQTPSVGSDGTGFLVAWAQGQRIQAQRLDGDGRLLGSSFLVGDLDVQRADQLPIVVFGGGVYLVAWQRTQFGVAWVRQYWASPIGTDGTIGGQELFHEASFDISIDGLRLATDGAGFLASWLQHTGVTMPVTSSVRARILDATGAGVSPDFPVAAGVSRRPFSGIGLASDGTNYLVTFSSRDDVLAQLVDSSGTLLTTAADTNFVISDAAAPQLDTATAWVASSFLTVFLDERWPSASIYMQTANGAGSLTGAASDVNTPVVAGIDDAARPAIASGGPSALAVWSMGTDIYSQLITP